MSARPYRLILDVSAVFGSNGRRGIGRYTEGLAKALLQADPATVVCAPAEYCDTSRAIEIGLPLHPLTPQLLRGLAADGPVVYVTGSLHEFPVAHRRLPALLGELTIPAVAVQYDVIPYLERERYQGTAALRRFYAAAAAEARSCDLLLAISHHTATTSAAALSIPSGRIATIGTGIDERFTPDSISDRGAMPYVVAVTGTDPRKNTEALISAFLAANDRLPVPHQLVIVCDTDESTRSRWQAMSSSRPDSVVLAGGVADAALVALYRGAALSVFPSLSEGFGLPVAEAAACGCPTISSNRTSIPEVLDEPASLFDPADVASMAAAIERGLTDESLRRTLSAAGERARARWTWGSVAQRALEAIDAMHASRSSRVARPSSERAEPPPPRPRLAIVGPFGGSPSGIGDYNERLLPHLDAVADTTCLVEATWGEAPLGTDGRRWPATALGRHIELTRFDHVVHTLGNSPFHLAGSRLAARFGGHVWLHEARLAELHIGTAHWLRDRTWAEEYLTSTLVDAIGAEATEALAGEAGWNGLLDVERYHRHGIRMLGSVLRKARSVIVSSSQAGMLVRSEGYDGPILTLPLAFPSAPPTSTDDGIPAGGEIAVLGWLSSAKGTQRAVSILATLAERRETRLVFVGKPLEGAAEAVAAAADEFGVADRVEMTGYLPSEQLPGRLRRCRVGLRLAERTDGEMSAAVMELVSLGVPTVTNLASMGADSPGLRVIEGASDEQLVAAIEPLLADDTAFATARSDARQRAAGWTFADVAARLVDWLDRHRAPSTGERSPR